MVTFGAILFKEEVKTALMKPVPVVALVCFAAANGCSGAPRTNRSVATPADRASPPAPASAAPRPGEAVASAVRRCGPDDSYRFLSSEFRCPTGKNPLAGNTAASRKARRGSVRDPSTGHFVDIYEVPCTPAPVRVYVDMYGCAEYQAKLRAPESDDAKRVQSDFSANRFQAVVGRCSAILNGKELGDAGTRCLTILPASLYLLGKRKQAISKLGEVCAAFPPPSVDSDVRARLVLETLGAISEGSERARIRIDRNQMGVDLTRFVAVCHVPDDQIEKLLEPMQEASRHAPQTVAVLDVPQ